MNIEKQMIWVFPLGLMMTYYLAIRPLLPPHTNFEMSAVFAMYLSCMASFYVANHKSHKLKSKSKKKEKF